MYRHLLSENWDEITKRVIKPLWNKRFKDLYISVKLDKDDFYSLAGEVLTIAFDDYKPDKSGVFTYATNVLIRKAKSELRNMRRQKRFIDTYSESIYQTVDEETNSTIEDMIEDVNGNDSEEIEVESALNEICSLLKPKERKVVRLSVIGLSNKEIADRLHTEVKVVNDIKKNIANRSDINRVLSIHNIRRF